MNPLQSRPASRVERTQTFNKTYMDFAPRVRGYLRRLTGGDHAEAEDVAQEVFLAAYNADESYRGRAPRLSWLLGIARRRWRDRNRAQHPPTAEIPDDALASGDNPEAQVVRAAHLQACLAQLDPAHRNALLLVFGQGLTYAEAARELGEPVGTVKWRVHAASRQMRALLSADDEEISQ